MGHYRPRPSETRSCPQCGQGFLSNHKRTRYCGESCRQLAYQARRKTPPPPAPTQSPASKPTSTVQNVGVAAAGAAAVALTNYVVNDRPVQQALLAQLNRLTQRVDQLTAALQANGLQLPPDWPPFSSSTAGEGPASSRFRTEQSSTLDEIADALRRKRS